MADRAAAAQRRSGDPGSAPAESRSGVERSARRPGARGPLLLLAVVVGIAVAAVCLRAGGSAPLGGVGVLHGLWLLVALVVFAGGWYGVAQYQARQGERPLGTPREERLQTLTVAALGIIALATTVGVAMLGMTHTGPPDLPPTNLAPGSPPPYETPSQRPQPTPAPARNNNSWTFPVGEVLMVLIGLLAVVAVVVLAVFVARWLRARSTPPTLRSALAPEDDDGAALGDAVRAGRLALQGEDVRAAVIACYAAMEESLVAGGVRRHAADSPADLLRRASEAGLLAGLAPHQLAGLFREARYSTHPMT